MKYQSIKEIIHYLPKSKIKAGEGLEDGLYPLFTSSSIQNKFYNEYLYNDECLIIGTGGHASIHYYNGKFATSTDNFIIKIDGYNIKFVYYYLLSNIYLLESKFKGAGLKHISKEGLESIKLPIVDINVQNDICSLMDKLSLQINIKQIEIIKLDELVKSQFIEMFESNIYKMKEATIEGVCFDMMIGPFGSALHKNEISSSGDVFVLGTDNVVDNTFRKKEIRYIDNKKYNELKKYTVKPNDIIISMMGTIGRTAVIPSDFEKAIISSHLCCLTPNTSEIYSDFLQKLFVLDRNVIKQIHSNKKGAIMSGLNLGIIKNIVINYPELSVQQKYLDIVKQIDKQKFEFEKQLEKLKELQESLMKEYFG